MNEIACFGMIDVAVQTVHSGVCNLRVQTAKAVFGLPRAGALLYCSARVEETEEVPVRVTPRLVKVVIRAAAMETSPAVRMIQPPRDGDLVVRANRTMVDGVANAPSSLGERTTA